MSTALQNALAAIDQAATDPLARAKARGLMRGYDARWSGAKWVTVATEQEFLIPIKNPETKRASRTFNQAGKYDGVLRYGDELWLLEHKTTSQGIEDFNAPYWRQLAIDSQVSSYMLAHWQGGQKLKGTLYDVIRKPSISPKLVSNDMRQKVIVGGSYCGDRMSDELRNSIGEPEITHETMEMYEARLVEDIAKRPEWYFQRRTVPRLDVEIAEYADERWEMAKQILQARNTKTFYRNSGACILYNSPCEYLGICSGHDTPDSDKWVTRPEVHSELNLDDGGLDVLTHSSMRCFATCRRKFFYRYELGIERADYEEKEALTFGSLIHTGLETWFNCFKETSNVNDCASAPVNGIGAPQSASEATFAI